MTWRPSRTPRECREIKEQYTVGRFVIHSYGNGKQLFLVTKNPCISFSAINPNVCTQKNGEPNPQGQASSRRSPRQGRRPASPHLSPPPVPPDQARLGRYPLSGDEDLDEGTSRMDIANCQALVDRCSWFVGQTGPRTSTNPYRFSCPSAPMGR